MFGTLSTRWPMKFACNFIFFFQVKVSTSVKCDVRKYRRSVQCTYSQLMKWVSQKSKPIKEKARSFSLSVCTCAFSSITKTDACVPLIYKSDKEGDLKYLRRMTVSMEHKSVARKGSWDSKVSVFVLSLCWMCSAHCVDNYVDFDSALN